MEAEQLYKYESAFRAIAREIQIQSDLEDHQRKEHISVSLMDEGRSKSYRKISSIVADALGIPQQITM
jgi:hypothetical protein